MTQQQIPTFDEVYEWCERHDGHPTEGWLALLLDGTYSVDEMRAAILADRTPQETAALDVDTKRLIDEVLQLPDYRGWSVAREDDYSRDMDERLVWRHDDYDEKIWFDIVRKSKDQIGLWINHDDPNDDPYHPRGGYETLTEHTAAAVFAVFKLLLDEHSSSSGEGDTDTDAEGDAP